LSCKEEGSWAALQTIFHLCVPKNDVAKPHF
jgi:hypothetical protein